MEEEIEFLNEWVSLEKYHFKIITMVTVLADNQKAYRGKLSDLCQYLSIKPVTVNINNIKSALNFASCMDCLIRPLPSFVLSSFHLL